MIKKCEPQRARGVGPLFREPPPRGILELAHGCDVMRDGAMLRASQRCDAPFPPGSRARMQAFGRYGGRGRRPFDRLRAGPADPAGRTGLMCFPPQVH